MKVETVLPSPGDAVRVAWGLGSVTGRVLESYAGIRPRVVVEIDAQELRDEAVSVTVPLGAVEPLERSTSSWAEAARYERAVAEALSRTLGENLREVRMNVELPDAEADVLASLTDGRKVIVEVKSRVSGRRGLERTVRRIDGLAAAQGAYGLVVVPQDPASGTWSGATRVSVVPWRNEEDDVHLSTAVKNLLALP